MYSTTIRSNNLHDDTHYIVTLQNNKKQNRKNNEPLKSIAADDIRAIVDRNVESRKNNARRQAWKLVSDAWKKDEDLQKSKRKVSDAMKSKRTEINDENEIIKEIKEQKEALKKEYGIEDDSEEQKTLNLLCKYQNNMHGLAYDSFSEEEREKLKNINTADLTEYQKRILTLNSKEIVSKTKIEDNKKILEVYTHVRRDLIQTELKSQNMVKASRASDEIKELANKDLVSFLVSEVKNKIDEENKEKQKEIQESKEKKIEEQRNSTNMKDKSRELRDEKEKEDVIFNSSNAMKQISSIEGQKNENKRMSEIQIQIEGVLKENQILNEDLKGIEIDLNY